MLDSQFIVRTTPIALPENQIRIGNWRITLLTSRLFRMERSENLQYCDEATQTVWFRDLPIVPFQTEKGKSFKIITEDVVLSVGDTLQDCFVILDGKKILLDNRANLLGTYRTLDRCDGDEYILAGGKREKIRLEYGVLSKNGVAIFDDSDSLILGNDGMLHARKSRETDIYVFAYGHFYREALKDLYRICGSTPKSPRYALGNW